jgi:hypothetical protein
VRWYFAAMASRKWLGAPGNGVLVQVGIDCGAGRILDLSRRREIRKSLRQINCIIADSQPRHLTDDRLGEVAGSLA